MVPITILINGQWETCPPATILQLIVRQGLSPQSLVVEFNGSIISQEQWPMVHLKNDDVLELLTFVGGG